MSKVEEYQQLKSEVDAGKEKHVRAETALSLAKDNLTALMKEIKEKCGVATVKALKSLLEKKEQEAEEALVSFRSKIDEIKEV